MCFLQIGAHSPLQSKELKHGQIKFLRVPVYNYYMIAVSHM